jgi:predicted RecB family nuclease
VGYEQNGLGAGHRYLVGVDLRADDLSASCDLLVRTDQPSPGGHSYCPQVVAGTYSVTDDQRFVLSYAGHVLGLIQGIPPDHGIVITLDGVAHRVARADGDPEVVSALGEVRGMVGQDLSKAPPVILNRHCPLCHFRSECRSKAEDADDLSLLDRMTPKPIRRYHKKGIFTVNQLSYLFRPRRNRKRSMARPILKLELQALALRTGKIYLQALPDLVRPQSTIFLDIGGIPDQQFHYLIGLVVRRGEEETIHSFWADSLELDFRTPTPLRPSCGAGFQ